MFVNLPSLLSAREITIDELARILGIHRNTLSAKLNGDSQFTLGEIDAIMIIFKEYNFQHIFARDGQKAKKQEQPAK